MILVGNIWLTKGVSILIAVVYMTCGIGFQGQNITKFLELSRLISHYKMPYVFLGDWNMEPEELRQQEWFQSLRCDII